MNGGLRRGVAVALNLAILVAFVWAVERYWGWGHLFAPWRRLPLDVVLLAVAGLLVSYGVRAARVYLAVPEIPRDRLGQCLKLILVSNAFNLLLPMRSGEASFPILMKRWFGTDLRHAAGVLVWLRLLDLQVLAAIGVVCAASGWLGRGSIAADWAPLAAALCIAAPVVLYVLRRPLARRLGAIDGHISALLLKLMDGLPHSAQGLARDMAMSWLGWGIKLAGLGWVLSRLAGLSASLGVLGAIGGDLSTVLPIHAPGGFGTYEVGVLVLLAPVAAPSPHLLAAAVDLHLLVLTTALVAGALAWVTPRRHRDPTDRSASGPAEQG